MIINNEMVTHSRQVIVHKAGSDWHDWIMPPGFTGSYYGYTFQTNKSIGNVLSLAVSPVTGRIYAVYGGSYSSETGLYYSDDDGGHWTRIYSALGYTGSVDAGYVFVTSTNRVIVISNDVANLDTPVKYSDDNGATWTDALTKDGVAWKNSMIKFMGEVTRSPEHTSVARNALVAASTNNVFYSTDNGATWANAIDTNNISTINRPDIVGMFQARYRRDKTPDDGTFYAANYVYLCSSSTSRNGVAGVSVSSPTYIKSGICGFLEYNSSHNHPNSKFDPDSQIYDPNAAVSISNITYGSHEAERFYSVCTLKTGEIILSAYKNSTYIIGRVIPHERRLMSGTTDTYTEGVDTSIIYDTSYASPIQEPFNCMICTESNRIIAGSSTQGIWCSDDKGITWYRTNIETDNWPCIVESSNGKIIAGNKNSSANGLGLHYSEPDRFATIVEGKPLGRAAVQALIDECKAYVQGLKNSV